ncbi:unnamed protein product, partial [Larinioides sclopetarius]
DRSILSEVLTTNVIICGYAYLPGLHLNLTLGHHGSLREMLFCGCLSQSTHL